MTTNWPTDQLTNCQLTNWLTDLPPARWIAPLEDEEPVDCLKRVQQVGAENKVGLTFRRGGGTYLGALIPDDKPKNRAWSAFGIRPSMGPNTLQQWLEAPNWVIGTPPTPPRCRLKDMRKVTGNWTLMTMNFNWTGAKALDISQSQMAEKPKSWRRWEDYWRSLVDSGYRMVGPHWGDTDWSIHYGYLAWGYSNKLVRNRRL